MNEFYELEDADSLTDWSQAILRLTGEYGVLDEGHLGGVKRILVFVVKQIFEVNEIKFFSD